MKMQQNQFEMNNQQHPQYGYGFDAGGGAYCGGENGGIVQPMVNHQLISELYSQMTTPGFTCQGPVQPPQQGEQQFMQSLGRTLQQGGQQFMQSLGRMS